jgi:hypothetical protein
LVFWAGFLTRFLTGQGLVLTIEGFLIAGLDIIDLRKLELVSTLFGFLTTRFLAGLDKVFSEHGVLERCTVMR